MKLYATCGTLRWVALSLLLLLLPNLPAFAQCPMGDVTLLTQAEVNQFAVDYPGCTTISGSLRIGPSTDIMNLNALGALEQISGSLIVSQNDDLTDMSGLSGLTAAGVQINISNNILLTTIDLSAVTGSLNDAFYVRNNDALTTLAAPETLTSIAADLDISGNPNLTTISGLENITSIGFSLVISNTQESNLPDFGNLTSVGRRIAFENNTNAMAINLPNVTGSIEDGFYIRNNDALTTLAAPETLISIAADLDISGNPNLTTISGLESVTSIGFSLVLSNTLEDELPDFSNLSSVGRQIAFARNENATSINVQNVSGGLSFGLLVERNPSLLSLAAPNNLTSVGTDIFINGNTSLTNFTGLENLISIGRDLFINLTPASEFPDFGNLQTVNRRIYIDQNANVTSLNFSNVNGPLTLDFRIIRNGSLASLAAPESLTSLAGTIQIAFNPNLSNFTGFGNLSNVGGTFWLSNLPATTFPDILKLSTIGQDLVVSTNSGIENLNWIANLNSIGGALRINSNSLLSNCTIDAVCAFLGGSGVRDIRNNTGCCLDEPILTDACNNVSSGTEEICDGEDNDCDGLIDEGFDQDGDGFSACEDDCDDTNAAINPLAVEICDGIDNNCDGTIDENESPVITSVTITVDPTPAGTPIAASATFTDPNDQDGHSASWDWDDGSVLNVPVAEVDQDNNSVSSQHTYSTPGVYIVTLTITDACGATDSETLTSYVVIYDPGEGFVTGGGWIQSPPGAYVDDPGLEGKANFGFVAKYLPGQSIPDGNTQFHFNTAGFKFRSTEYDWLIIAGPKAKYKGTGQVNNQGNYGFMVTAIDGQINGGGGVDKFRIKIWDKDNNDAVVYDNKMGADDLGYDTQELAGGSITIHKNGPGGGNNLAAAPLTVASAPPMVLQAFPNPFRREVRLVFRVPEPSPVRIRIFNGQGRQVHVLNFTTLDAGEHQVVWDGSSERGGVLPSGVYLARLEAGAASAVQRLVLIR